jgi:hypothetical protein
MNVLPAAPTVPKSETSFGENPGELDELFSFVCCAAAGNAHKKATASPNTIRTFMWPPNLRRVPNGSSLARILIGTGSNAKRKLWMGTITKSLWVSYDFLMAGPLVWKRPRGSADETMRRDPDNDFSRRVSNCRDRFRRLRVD